MISFVRVDNRLIHGQVVEAWLPHLKVARVVVADDEAAQSPLIRAAMGLAVPAHVEVVIRPLAEVDFPALTADEVLTLVLFRDVASVVRAKDLGMDLAHLNLGNVHFATGKRQVSTSVFLSPDELAQLTRLAQAGAEVEARGVPTDRPIALAELVERFEKGGAQTR